MIENKNVRKILGSVLLTPAIIVVVIWFCNSIYVMISHPLETVVAIIIITIVVIMTFIAAHLLVD